MNRRIILCYFVLLGLGFVTSASATPCGDGYSRRDSAEVTELFKQSTTLLAGAENVAWQSASGVFSVNQRLALENEFQAIINYINDTLGAGPRRGISPRTGRFLDQVLDREYLGLTGATVVSTTIETSQIVARASMHKSAQAIARIWACH
ncbi:MAG: hypothetical protein K1X83_10490 [Oligoflexia bacterium]|nr:hypothetical protein [Oligoflexia bacterium]